jgi:Na+-translocating ferredoxin:NAD+ oxidoreductase RnfG subunit
MSFTSDHKKEIILAVIALISGVLISVVNLFQDSGETVNQTINIGNTTSQGGVEINVEKK